MVKLGNDWDILLADEFKKEYYRNLRKFLIKEYNTKTVYPDPYDIFNALKHTSLANTKVVVLGQDPYHNKGQANGLCFSVKDGVSKPPSLINIFKELESDLGIKNDKTGDLTSWADQGVMLLNTVLTVRENEPNSHKGKGWEILTDKIISILNEDENKKVFLLWGREAKMKVSLINNPNHLVLTAAHPSPLSAGRGFFSCRHFSRTNRFLEDHQIGPINWKI